VRQIDVMRPGTLEIRPNLDEDVHAYQSRGLSRVVVLGLVTAPSISAVNTVSGPVRKSNVRKRCSTSGTESVLAGLTSQLLFGVTLRLGWQAQQSGADREPSKQGAGPWPCLGVSLEHKHAYSVVWRIKACRMARWRSGLVADIWRHAVRGSRLMVLERYPASVALAPTTTRRGWSARGLLTQSTPLGIVLPAT
jgi:hypothetical protein